MTLQQICASDKDFLTAVDVAEVLKINPATLRAAAAERPELLGFPVCVMGTRVKIPRRSFLTFMGVESGETQQ